jgi:threonyl-tRNA synthetase
MGLELVMDEGGGAFYGPKISVQARDAIGRTWQMSTVQLDFNLPRALRARVRRGRQRPAPADHDPPGPVRLGGALHGRADRALRRRAADLAVARAGAGAPGQRGPRRPTPSRWPRRLRGAGLRVSVDDAARTWARIRKAKLTKVPYILVVGDDDVAAQTVGVNPRSSTASPSAGST